jgi:hypothetical protein
MENEKKIWRIEQYAHKAWTVSLALAQEAARAGQYGKGYAVVAQEARIFADKLFEYTAKAKFDGADETMFKGIVDFAIEMKFLSVNAALEIHRMVEISMDFNIPKSMAVFADELRRIAVGLNELADKSMWQRPFTMPELASPSRSAARDFFFFYSICGYSLIENLKNIQELCYSRKTDIEGKIFSLRGIKMPVINCYRFFNLPYKRFDENWLTLMVINPKGQNYEGPDEIYAVPIDDLDINAIVYTRIGCAVPPKRGHAFADHARECWDLIGGDQAVLADWKKFIS